jgi:hypothetical protein
MHQAIRKTHAARHEIIGSPQPPRPPLPLPVFLFQVPTWRRRRRRRRRGLLRLLVRSSTSLLTSSIRLSSSVRTPLWHPPRRNRQSPPGSQRSRRRRSSSNSRRRRGSDGLAIPAPPSSIRCRSSASTSSLTSTASTCVSVPSSSQAWHIRPSYSALLLHTCTPSLDISEMLVLIMAHIFQ